MPYSLRTYDGTNLVTIADGLVDDQVTTPLFLIGKNVTGYGTRQNENFLYLLENFAGINAPSTPRQGQLWFDKTPDATKLNVYDGAHWKGLGITAISTSQPTTLAIGDLWFDSQNSQLWAKSGTGTDFTLVGPDVLPGFGVTKLVPKLLKDINDTSHVALDITVNDEILGVISQDAFSLGGNQDEYSAGFTNVVRGITLRPGATLAGLDIPSRTTSEVINEQWNFSSGIKLGDTSSITFDSNGNLVLNAPTTNVVINSLNLLPASVNASIGTSTQPFSEIVATNFSSGSAINPMSIEGDVQLYTNSKLRPYMDNNVALGSSVGRWSNVYTYGLSAGSPTSNGTLEGDWIVETGGALTTPTLNATHFSAGNVASDGNVTGQWSINVGSTWQATQLLDSNWQPLSPDVEPNPNTVVLRDQYGQVKATRFIGSLLGNVVGDTTGTHRGSVFGDVTGNVRASITTSTNVYSSMVTATNIYGYLQGPVKGNVNGNVTGNVTGNVISVDLSQTLVDASTKIIGYGGASIYGNLNGDVSGNVVAPGDSTIMLNARQKIIGYAGATIRGNVTGSVIGTVKTTDGTVVVDGGTNQIGYTSANIVGNLTGNVTASTIGTTSLTADGLITASAGSGATKGIAFPADPGGGSGDVAYIKYYAYFAEKTNLEIGVSNDPIASGTQDSINLVSSGGVGVNKQTPRYALDVNGDIGCSVLHGTATDSQLWGGSNKYVSVSPPTNDQGNDGDFWFQREP